MITKLSGSSGTSIQSGDKVALKTWKGLYVAADGGGGGALNGNRAAPGSWETFTITLATMPPANNDCTQNYTGKNNEVGIPNGDTRFLCYQSRWYDCGWEQNDPNWETKATKGQVVGSWSCNLPQSQWQRTGQGTLIWAATLNGQSWTGPVVVNGYAPPNNTPVSNLSVPTGNYPGAPVGAYSYSYVSGGPLGATFQNITPSGTQTLSANGTITFTFNFTQ